MRTILFSMAIGVLIASPVAAENWLAGPDQTAECCGSPSKCGICGCKAQCAKRMCNIVAGTKKVKKHVWVVECEEFCTLLPGCKPCGDCDKCGSCCDKKCGGCDKGCGKDPCEELKKREVIPPKSGKARCRKKLVKKEVICEVPVYKAKGVYTCGGCKDSDAPVKPAPATKGPTKAEKTTDHAPFPPTLTGVGYFTEIKK